MHHLPRYPVTGFLKPAVGPNTDRYMFCEEKHRLLHNEEEEREPREQSGKEGREKGRRRKGKRGREGEEREGRAGSSEERYVVGRGWDRQEGMRGKRRGREGTGERGAEQIRRQRLSKLLPHPWAFKSRKPWADLEDQNLQFQSRYFLCGQRKVGVVGGGCKRKWRQYGRKRPEIQTAGLTLPILPVATCLQEEGPRSSGAASRKCGLLAGAALRVLGYWWVIR